MKKHAFAARSDTKKALSPDTYSLDVVTRYGSLVGLNGHFLFIFLFAWLGIWPMALVNIASCLIYLFCYWMNQKGKVHLVMLLGATEVIAHAILAVAFVGWESGFHYYMLALIPLIFYSRIWRTSFKSLLVSILCGLYIGLYLFTQKVSPWTAQDRQIISLIGVVNIITLFIVYSVVAHLYRSAATYAEKSLMLANQQMEHLAHTDPLTKLINRRSIIDQIDREVARFHETGHAFSVILGDVDDFKKINDTFGHEVGDQILVKVSELLRASVREHDRVSRWGGEEFLVLLPETELGEARRVAERLREVVMSAQMVIGEAQSRVTITFGVSTYAGSPEVNRVIRRADLAMYEGKQLGKNCVVIGPSEA